jgi:hypothetical protein
MTTQALQVVLRAEGYRLAASIAQDRAAAACAPAKN